VRDKRKRKQKDKNYVNKHSLSDVAYLGLSILYGNYSKLFRKEYSVWYLKWK
jgi:hypothetical protein